MNLKRVDAFSTRFISMTNRISAVEIKKSMTEFMSGNDPPDEPEKERAGLGCPALTKNQKLRENSTRSAFAPMRARIDPAIVAKSPVAKPVSAPSIEKPPTNPKPAPPAEINARIELWLEVGPRPEKLNAIWGYLPKPISHTWRACVCLNTLLWPAQGAIARADRQAVRWLFSVALLERLSICTLKQNPELIAARNYIIAVVLGAKHDRWQGVLWAAYLLKDHELTKAIDTLPIYGAEPEPGPHKVASFQIGGA